MRRFVLWLPEYAEEMLDCKRILVEVGTRGYWPVPDDTEEDDLDEAVVVSMLIGVFCGWDHEDTKEVWDYIKSLES